MGGLGIKAAQQIYYTFMQSVHCVHVYLSLLLLLLLRWSLTAQNKQTCKQISHSSNYNNPHLHMRKNPKDYTHRSVASSMCNPNIFTKKIFPIIKSIKKRGVISYSPQKSLTEVGSSIPQRGFMAGTSRQNPFQRNIYNPLHIT